MCHRQLFWDSQLSGWGGQLAEGDGDPHEECQGGEERLYGADHAGGAQW